MLLDVSLENNQHYKVRIQDKRSNPGKGLTLSLRHLGFAANEKGVFGPPSTIVR